MEYEDNETREVLQPYLDGKIYTFNGDLEFISSTHAGKPVALLKDISMEESNLDVCEHIWIKLSKRTLASLRRVKMGTRVGVRARVVEYEKGGRTQYGFQVCAISTPY